jgi:hypothetical protein
LTLSTEVVETAATLKVAFTTIDPLSPNVHGSVPLQPLPDQPVKMAPAAGAGDRVTRVPLGYVTEQVEPQLIPVGLLATIPAPPPDLVTVSANPPDAVLPQASLE